MGMSSHLRVLFTSYSVSSISNFERKYGAKGDDEDEDEEEKCEQEEHAHRSGHSIDGILADRCK